MTGWIAHLFTCQSQEWISPLTNSYSLMGGVVVRPKWGNQASKGSPLKGWRKRATEGCAIEDGVIGPPRGAPLKEMEEADH